MRAQQLARARICALRTACTRLGIACRAITQPVRHGSQMRRLPLTNRGRSQGHRAAPVIGRPLADRWLSPDFYQRCGVSQAVAS
jgi:hypothetical protein